MSALVSVASAAVTVGTTPELVRALLPETPETSTIATHEMGAGDPDAAAADHSLRSADIARSAGTPAALSVASFNLASDGHGSPLPVHATADNVNCGLMTGPTAMAAGDALLPLSVVVILGVNALIGVFLQAVLDGGVFRSDARNRDDWEQLSRMGA